MPAGDVRIFLVHGEVQDADASADDLGAGGVFQHEHLARLQRRWVRRVDHPEALWFVTSVPGVRDADPPFVHGHAADAARGVEGGHFSQGGRVGYVDNPQPAVRPVVAAGSNRAARLRNAFARDVLPEVIEHVSELDAAQQAASDAP